MTIPASHCEAVLRGMSKRADKEGDWIEVKFQLHPNEVPPALWNADLRSRWQLAFVEIGDNEEPKVPEKPKRPPATTRAEKARRLCGIRDFQEFMRSKLAVTGSSEAYWLNEKPADRYRLTSEYVKIDCGVQSKSALDPAPSARADTHAPAVKWDQLVAEYEQQAGRMAERH